MYKRAREGKIKIAGVGGTYIEEKKPRVLIETYKVSAKKAAQIIFKKLQNLKWS